MFSCDLAHYFSDSVIFWANILVVLSAFHIRGCAALQLQRARWSVAIVLAMVQSSQRVDDSTNPPSDSSLCGDKICLFILLNYLESGQRTAIAELL